MEGNDEFAPGMPSMPDLEVKQTKQNCDSDIVILELQYGEL